MCHGIHTSIETSTRCCKWFVYVWYLLGCVMTTKGCMFKFWRDVLNFLLNFSIIAAFLISILVMIFSCHCFQSPCSKV
jgi:hypothetical protein